MRVVGCGAFDRNWHRLVDATDLSWKEESRDSVTRSVSNYSTFTDIFSQKLGEFCDSFAKGIDPVNSRLSHYMLDTIEMHIELTSKGEIRLVAAANADVRGAIKLTFRARRPE